MFGADVAGRLVLVREAGAGWSEIVRQLKGEAARQSVAGVGGNPVWLLRAQLSCPISRSRLRHAGDVADDDYRQWTSDGAVLARIGRVLFDQQLRVSVRMPQELAATAISAWEREESASTLPRETSEQVATRHRAAVLALIGLTLQGHGVVQGDEMVVDLDAWHVGSALDAAEEEGLLDGVTPRP